MSESKTISPIDLSRLFDVSLDLLCLATTDGYFQRVNPAFEKVLGHTEEVLLSTSFLEFVHPDDRSATLAELASLSCGRETIGFENRYACSDGSYKTLLWTAAPEPNSKLIYASARDVTQQRADAIAVQHSKRAATLGTMTAGTMTAGIAHDLNNLLTPILLSVEILKSKQIVNDDLTCKLFDQLFDAIEQGRQLTGQLLDLAKGEPIAFQPVDLCQVIQKAANAIRAGLSAEREFDIDVEPRLGVVFGSETQLFQVIFNLLKNAQDATSAGGVFSISAKNGSNVKHDWMDSPSHFVDPARFVTIEIRDTGKGIPSEHREQIFAPYFSSHPEDGGTGLGLAVVSRIVADHGGNIRFESADGIGSTFAIDLPAKLDVSESHTT